MEIWDLYDKFGNPLGKTIERGKPLPQNEYHLVVSIWIFNSKGELLISQRTPNKTYPLLWEVTSGSVIAGETSYTGALRETKEELGIDLTTHGTFYKRLIRDYVEFRDLYDIWVFYEEVDLKNLTFQVDEVMDAKWATEEEILSLLDKGEFVPLFYYVKEMFHYFHLNDSQFSQDKG